MMQSEAQIRRKIRRLKFYYLKKRYERDLSRRPWNCSHNHIYSPPPTKLPVLEMDFSDIPPRDSPYRKGESCSPTVSRPILVEAEESGVSIRICTYGKAEDEWNGVICEEVGTAKKCPKFSLSKTKDQVRDDFERDPHDPNILVKSYKDVAALEWVLDEMGSHVRLRWLQRILLRFLGRAPKQEPPETDGDRLLCDSFQEE